MEYKHNWHLIVFGLIYIIFILGLQGVLLGLLSQYKEDTLNIKSVNNKPVNNKPVNNKPVNNKPVNNKPVNNKPVNNKPKTMKKILNKITLPSLDNIAKTARK